MFNPWPSEFSELSVLPKRHDVQSLSHTPLTIHMIKLAKLIK